MRPLRKTLRTLRLKKRRRDIRQKNSGEFVQFVAKERNVSNVKSLKVESRSRSIFTNNLQPTTYNL